MDLSRYISIKDMTSQPGESLVYVDSQYGQAGIETGLGRVVRKIKPGVKQQIKYCVPGIPVSPEFPPF